MVYRKLLIAPRPIVIDRYGSEKLVLKDQACACCGFSWLHRNMGIAILFTCRMYRREGLAVLMNMNRFVHLVPGREWKPTIPKCRITVGIEHVKHLLSLALIHLDHELVPLLVAERVDVLLFMNLLLRHRVQLESLVVCVDQPENSIGTGYELGAAETYIPVTMRLSSEGLIKKLFVGCHKRFICVTDNAVENERWVQQYRVEERDMTDIWDSLESKSKGRQGLTVFESWEDPDEMENTVIIDVERAKSVFAMQKSDHMRIDDADLERWKWYGQRVEVEECGMQKDNTNEMEDVADEEDGGQHEYFKELNGLDSWVKLKTAGGKQYRAMFVKPRYAQSSRDQSWRWVDNQEEEDDEGEDDEYYDRSISEEDYNDLRKTQAWWQSYLVANTPGQQKVTDWFHKVTKTEWLESLPKSDLPMCYRAPGARAHVLYRDATTSTQEW